MEFIVHGVAKSRTWLSDFHFSIIQSRKEWNIIWINGHKETLISSEQNLIEGKNSKLSQKII